jgi:hypothetical protein
MIDHLEKHTEFKINLQFPNTDETGKIYRNLKVIVFA